MKPPCYRCTRRSAICHAQCVEYHEWAADVRRQHIDERTRDSEGKAYASENIVKWHKRRKRK